MVDETKSTAELVKQAFEEARDLVRLEVKLATDEVKIDMRQTQAAAVGFGIAAALGIIGLTLLAVAIPLAFVHAAIAALITGGVFLVIAGGVAIVGWFLFPKKPLKETRKTTRRGLTELEEAL
ncbi:MAG TPA: phage holin family protein [Polyangiaceae bacterium]|jgi:hypothetical protein